EARQELAQRSTDDVPEPSLPLERIVHFAKDQIGELSVLVGHQFHDAEAFVGRSEQPSIGVLDDACDVAATHVADSGNAHDRTYIASIAASSGMSSPRRAS